MSRRILRGGPYCDSRFLRSTRRIWDLPKYRYRDDGFRLVVRKAG